MLEAVIGGSSASACTPHWLWERWVLCVAWAESFQLYPRFFFFFFFTNRVRHTPIDVSFDRQPPRSRVQYNRVIELMLCGVSAASARSRRVELAKGVFFLQTRVGESFGMFTNMFSVSVGVCCIH
jgi:hypothetical protein